MNEQQNTMGKIEGKKSVAQFHLLGDSSRQFFDNPMLNVSQLGDLLNVPQKTVRHWVYRREIPHYKIGRHLRFNSHEIQQWIAKRRIKHEY